MSGKSKLICDFRDLQIFPQSSVSWYITGIAVYSGALSGIIVILIKRLVTLGVNNWEKKNALSHNRNTERQTQRI